MGMVRPSHKLKTLMVAFAIALLPLLAHAQPEGGPSSGPSCDRQCLSSLVDQVLKSMVAHDPYALPLAHVYAATENLHPAALGMMTLWRSVTRAGEPDFLALDPVAGQAFFEMQISEGGDLSALWGRIRVVDRKITELEFYINRSRGDHGFSFSAKDLPDNLHSWMHPPADRRRASRTMLEKLARASFNAHDNLQVAIGHDCQFIEAGTHVIDPGLPGVPPPASRPGRDPNAPLGCVFPPFRPTDLQARQVAIDTDLGIVVVAGMVPGRVFPYPYYGHMISAFIPDDMKQPQDAQLSWFEKEKRRGSEPLLRPAPATGVTMQVLQFYDGKLQGEQINVHLGPPGKRSVWLEPGM
jgi:hypothetical protein